MRRFSFEALCAFNVDGGGGGSGGAAGGDGGGTPAGTSGGADGAPANLLAAAEAAAATAGGNPAGGPQQAYYPDGLPDAFKGTSDRETIDKLAGELGRQPKPPATPKDYKFEPGDDFVQKHGDLKDDPVLGVWRELAHEIGLGQDAFASVVPKFYDRLEKAGLIDPPIDWTKESTKLEPMSGDPKERAIKALQRVKNVEGQVHALQTRGVINKEDAIVLSTAFYDAAHVQAFEKLFALIPQQHGPQGGGTGAGSGYDWAQADKDMSDARYSTTSPTYDPAFRRSADEKMAALPKRGGFRVG